MHRKILTDLLPGTLALGLFTLSAHADAWPEYRGAAGDGISTENVSAQWPKDGLKKLWTVPTPTGFSSFVIADGKAYTVVKREKEGVASETCVCLDSNTGKELWSAVTGVAKYQGGGDSGADGNKGGDGPRSTPAVSEGRVYVYSADMVLHCLDARDGKVVWTKDVPADHKGRNIGWKSAISPVVDDKMVFVAGGGPGESMLAFDKADGNVVWKTGDEAMTHASPIVADIGGVRQVVFLMQSGLVSLDVKNGKELWRQAFPHKVSTACLPVVAGDIVFVTAGYEVGGGAYQVKKQGDSFTSTELWRIKGDRQVASLWSPPVQKDGHLFGMLSYKRYGTGPLKCVDIRTGEVKWEQPGFGAGNVLLAGKHLLALSDDGQVVLAQANPEKYVELARFKAVSGKCWTTPALANGRLYVRSTKEGACFELP